MTYTKDQLQMLRKSVEILIEAEDHYASMLPIIPKSSKIGEWLGAYSSKTLQIERDATLQGHKLAVTNAKLVLHLIDQLLGEKKFCWAVNPNFYQS